MKKNLLFIILILLSMASLAKKNEKHKSQLEKEQSLLDFSNLKSVIVNDGLIKEKIANDKIVHEIKVETKKIALNRYRYPSEGDFWWNMSEMWLVKNAQSLQWDFPKPKYGIGVAFKGLLEKLGYYNRRFKILIVNSPNLVHMGLPSKDGEMIFLLSLPFLRNLDLTKVDIALLLLEDFFRLEEKLFVSNLNVDTSRLGTNFQKAKFDKNYILDIQKKYSEVVFKKGFTFQQQYKVTKKIAGVLKANPSLWSAYYKLLQKIDGFIKSDLLYKNYLKIYPSPELQIKWISPKKKVL